MMTCGDSAEKSGPERMANQGCNIWYLHPAHPSVSSFEATFLVSSGHASDNDLATREKSRRGPRRAEWPVRTLACPD